MVQPLVKVQARRRVLMTILRLALLTASVWALKREFAGVTPAALLHRFARYGRTHVALGLIAVAASFLLLGAIELLALRASREDAPSLGRVPAPTAFATAFVAHAVSQSVGIALLTGTAVRLRSYSRRGMNPTEVAQTSAAITLTVTLGLLAAGGWALMARDVPIIVGGRALLLRPIGAALCLTVAAYLAWSLARRGHALSRGRWRIPRPAPLVALAQVALSTADWLVTGAVLYAFIPPSLGLGVAAFLQLYIIAQLLGVLSHVPAGAGVFEVAFLALATAANPDADRPALLAAIVMYRAAYYLLPLCAAMLLAGGSELRRSRRFAAERGTAARMNGLKVALVPDAD